MHTIIGSGGIIAKETVKELNRRNIPLRLCSRNPVQIEGKGELKKTDLLNRAETLEAVKGSEVVYLTAGLQYDIKVWQAQWPVIMDNVINACKETGAKLVFFDNVYCYGKVSGVMTEQTPYNPCSKKGEVRAKIARQLEDEWKKGNITGLIARAADFYGPDTPLSFFSATVFENLAKGKTPQLMGNPDALHSLTYTPDAGKATALLGCSPEAFNTVWHLPTASPALKFRELLAICSAEFGKEAALSALPGFMIPILGLFLKVIAESKEMMYQYNFDYQFSSEAFEKKFGVTPTSYAEGLKASADWYKKTKK